MHGNSNVVDIAGFSAFSAQARQYRPSEATWELERCFRSNFAQARSVSLRYKGSLAQAWI